MEEVQQLLGQWGLQQLADVFREQEICIRALKTLTERDICELIPKIGPRSIFRAKLTEWKSGNDNNDECAATVSTMTRLLESVPYEASLDEINPTSVIKIEEATHGKDDILAPQPPNAESLLEGLMGSPPNLRRRSTGDPKMFVHDENLLGFENNDTTTVMQRRATKRAYFQGEKLNVREILESNFDGRKAIAFYSVNKTLDCSHRRKIVNALINTAIEKKIGMYVDLFDDLAQQIVGLFPSETYDTYFMPRDGSSSPKGALYNKFLNLSRQLRKDGLLGYRNKSAAYRMDL